ncbi:IQ calmodulin-binding motif protein, putative (macronuclear) [Tetrahymena thermophila SB210]|uniref:IQ calmodulin-binding motif protein, putative n=1 Tax=Tetrahymena thermophila (strain SB210) TaxID=312017 RepID=I7MHX7_TETTS|nr:IQ calmodulin-binding motif protein, putative [Tetrahymena thermophila SB210]EAS03726.2 IQ calmodulin-binding motif protein, putative [Tetrahymena thermophila SB210]|eukprot:XP_001023971.2 IQ calmodulin-binding motif protein, putative [Tetrahymena thermophila SB210]
MRQKKAQDTTQQLNFNVNGNQCRQEQPDQQQYNYQILKNSQRQSDCSQQQNETYRLQNNQSYYKNEGQASMLTSSQFSQPFVLDQQLTIQKPAAIQGRKIDSQQQVQVSFRQSLNHQPNMFFQNQQVTMQFNPIQQREKGFQNQIYQGQIQNQIFQTSSNSQQSLSSNSSTILMKKKYSHNKEDQFNQGPINQIINMDMQHQPNSQKKKRPTSSLNQNQLKTIYEDIKKTTRKPRSASNTPQKDRSYREKSSRSASKKKQEEKSQKKLSQTQEIKAVSKINNENQENQLNKNENCSDKQLLQASSARKKKKSSNSVHIKPVSKINEPQQHQQNSNSKSKSPGKVSKNSLHNGVQHIIGNGKVLGEKNFNSPQKSGKAVSTTKSPEDKQRKKKKSSLSKSKSKPRLNHAKSTSQLIVSHYQQSHTQSIQNDIPKHQSTSIQNLKEIDTFIKKNAQKIQFEQFMKKQEEIEERLKNKQEEEKRKIQNEQIRKENLVKFCKLKKANENIQSQQNIHMTTLQLQQKYAWGTNQQRIKMHQIIQNQLFSQQQQQSHQQSIERNQFNNTYAFQKGQFNNSEEDFQNQLIEKEKKRRQQSGLSFLNNYDEQIIKKKVEYEKNKQELIAKNDPNEEQNKKKLVAPLNHEEIKKFMILKKRRLENENKKRQEQQKERQERLKNNLHILDQEIKNQRQNNSCQVQLQQENKHFANTNNQNHQRSKSQQRKKKNRTVSTPNLERFFNKTQNFNNIGLNNQDNFLQKDLIHKQLINYNENYIPNRSVQEYEEEMFLQNNYFSNTQQQYAKKYDQNNYNQNILQNHQISSNNNAGNSTDINEENFDLLNMEFKKMFNLSGNNDNKLMEFSQSINKTHQLTTQGQSNNGSNKLGSSGKKGKCKQIDFIKPKSISMHASSSVGNLKLAQGFDSSHFGNIQNVNPQFIKMKENSKEKNSKKPRKSQVTSISPEPKILTKSNSTVFKHIPQQSGFDNNKKQPLYQKIEGQDQIIPKDKYIQELINQKKDELKNMYNQINARMNLIKHNVNVNEQQPKANNQHEINLEDKDDQEIYEQKYFNQPLNNKKIQQAILQQQHVNSNSLGSVNSSQRRVHISNASPIKEEPEEEDKGHFSNLPHPQNNANTQNNYVNSFQQIFQNNKKDFIPTDSSNLTNNNYPHAINSNPNESDSLRNNQNLKDFQQGNFKKPNFKDNDIIHSNPSSQQSNLMISPIQDGSVNFPFNQIQNNSKASIHSQSKATPSKSLSGISAIESKKDLPNKQNNEQTINLIAPANTQQLLNGPIQQNVSEQQISQIHSRNESQIIPADPNAPVSLNLKETIQSKSYISTKNDCRFSQINQIPQQDTDQQLSDLENGMLSSKDLQIQQNEEMPILPLNINLQHRVQQMKKRTHNTDNEESQDSTLRNKIAAPFGQEGANQQMQKNAQKDRSVNGIQVAITSKTPQSSNREDNNKRSQYQNAQKDYTQFEQQEDIKLELIKEVETQNQMSSSNFESQVFQKNFNNTNPSLQPINNQKAPQQTPRENNKQNSNQSDDAEEIDVDYLYDLDYDQLQELKMIIFQSDPENPEIQALSEQLILYDAAATIIQKVFRGYYTRKCIAAIIEYQRQQDEEEELLYQQAEKFLEENQIEPEELLEGNPIPLMLQQQQQNIPYYSSDQLKEYEKREMQFNKNQNSEQQQQQQIQNDNSNNMISENEFPIKINDYQNSYNKEENTFNRESQGNHPFFTSLSMPEQSINNELYHQKNYNDDLLQPKQSDFMPDFDFYDKTEKSQQNSAENQKSNSGINNISESNAVHPFVQQSLQNQNVNIESGKLNNNNNNNTLTVNQPNQLQKNKFIDGINNQNYRDQSFNQLNMKEINDQSKSLVTVKEFDTSSKDNYKGVDSVVSQNNQDLGKNIFSPNNQSHLQMEISKLQEQAKMWSQMINQIVQLPENQSQQFKNDALKILNDLQKQSEMSKQILIENIKLNQQIQKSPIISTDRFPLSEIDNMNDKLNCSNLKSGDISQANDKEMVISDKSIQNRQSSQNYQQIQIAQKQNQSLVDDKKTQNQQGQTSKKNLQLDIEEIESNYNLQQRGQKIEKDQKSTDSKVNDQQQGRKNSENDVISQEQRAMVRALSVSSVESNELRYVNIVANNSLGISNKITKSKQNIIDRLNSDHVLNSNSNRNSHNGNESVSSVGSSFFDKQPFKEFTSKILQKYTMPQESVEELIKTREEAIEQKHKTQMDLIHKMHERNRISPKSFERKQFELEKWVSKERENLKVVKKEIERGWEQFAQTIKQTKRDLEFLEQTKRIDTSKLLQSSEEDQLRRLLSMRSESEHSIEEIGFAERRSLDGVYSFKNHQVEDPNKIKIVDNYKPVDYSSLSNTSQSNIRNRNNSDNTSQDASIRSRQVSQPNSINVEEINQYPESDQMFEGTCNSNTKSNTKYLNVEQQLQLAQKNQEAIQKQQLQKQTDSSKIEQNKTKDQNEEKITNTLDKQARNISSNGSSVYDGDEEIDQFLTAEKNKNEGNIQISQRRAFDMYGYSDEDDYGINNQNLHQNNEIYIDQESENNDRLDVSPIFTVSSASKQGTQDKESLKYLIHNQGEIAQNMKIESDNKYDKIKQFNKRNSQDSRMSESQPGSPLSQSSKKNQDPFQTIEYEDDGNSKKQTVSSKVSPKLGFVRGDLLQEEGIDDKVNYVSDQTINYLVDDAAKDIKNIKDKQQNEKDTNLQGNMIQINFLEPIKARQNVYNLDDFPDVSEKASSLETSSGIFKAVNPLTESSNIQDKRNQLQNKEEEQLQKLNNNNNNNTNTKQKNLIPSPPNSPTQRENSGSNKNIGDKKPLQNNFLLDLVQNGQKQNMQEIKQGLSNQIEKEKQDKMAPEDLYITQNSQQQLQFSENILTTQNNPPGLECATLNFIKDYLVAFSEFIKDNFTDEFLERVNIPLGMDPQEFLKTFTITETIDNSNGEISAAPIYPIVKYIHMQRPVVSEELFAHFNEIFNRERDLSLMTEELFELERFHMRMIFDCFNEALDSMRPFGLRGKPLPWKINSNKLSSIIITPDNIEKILGLAIAKVLKWGSFLCGFIPERIESPTGEIVQIEDEYLNQIKEDRLAQMLENEVIENEDKWLTYEDEETDVQLEIADDIFNYIIEETAMIIQSVQSGQAINQIKNETSSDLNDNQNIERNFNNNSYETLSKNIFGNPNITKGAKKQGLGGGIRPTNDLGISQKQAQEKKQLQKELFLKNLQNSNLNNNQSSQKDQLNSSF